MGRKILFLVFVLVLFFSFNSLALKQEVDIDSKIQHIYLYPDSSMVIREGEVELEQGHYRLIFDDILDVFEEKTISVELGQSTVGMAGIMGVSIETIFLEEEPAEKIRQLQDEINLLEKEIRRISSEKSSWNDKKEFLNTIIYFFQGGNQNNNETIQIPSTEQLESIYIFLDEKLKTIYGQVLNDDFQIEAYQEKITLLRKQLQQITEGQREIKKIIVIELEVYQRNKIEFLLSYQLDKGISWRPVYDVRANLKEKTIELLTYALINQATGVDWENVYISLSTARPTASGNLPSIESWFLRPYQTPQRIGKTMEMTLSSNEETDKVSADSINEQKLLVPVEHQGTSVTFHIPHQVSLASGSSQEKVLINQEELPVQFNYMAYPRMSPFMYFNASIESKIDIPLLPGQLNIFLDGGFTGSTSIGYIPPGEDFDISLGIAENIRVKRELLKKFTDETLISTIPSSKIVTEYEYKITVENYQEMESLCHIFENIPVSEDDRIQIKLNRVSKEPEEKDWNNKKGVWRWEFLLEPQEKTEIDIVYSVSHPRDMLITGLP